MSIVQLLQSEIMIDFDRGLDKLLALPLSEAIAILHQLSADSNDEFRCRAIAGMVKVSIENAIPLAIRSLYDSEPTVRVNAIFALWEMKSHAGIQPILHLLESDPDELVRCWAAIYLGLLGDSSTINSLETCIQYDQAVDHEGTPIADIARKAIGRIRSRIPENGGPI